MNYWGAVLGGAILTLVLTRAVLLLLSKFSVDKKASILISSGSVFLICLLIYKGPPVGAFLIYLPSLILWSIYDIYKVSRKYRVDSPGSGIITPSVNEEVKSKKAESINVNHAGNLYAARAKELIKRSMDGNHDVVEVLLGELNALSNYELRDKLRYIMMISAVTLAFMTLNKISDEEERSKLAGAIESELKSYNNDALECMYECCLYVEESGKPDLPKWSNSAVSEIINELKINHGLNREASILTLAFGNWMWSNVLSDQRFKDRLSGLPYQKKMNLLLAASLPITINMAAWWDYEKLLIEPNQFRLPF